MEIDLNEIPAQQQFTAAAVTAQRLPDRNDEWVMVPVHTSAIDPLQCISVSRILRASAALLTELLGTGQLPGNLEEQINNNLNELESVTPALDSMAQGLNNMRRRVDPQYPIWPGVRPAVES